MEREGTAGLLAEALLDSCLLRDPAWNSTIHRFVFIFKQFIFKHRFVLISLNVFIFISKPKDDGSFWFHNYLI